MVVRVTAPETQVKKVATDGTTIVKKIVVGTPIRSVVGGLQITSLADVSINNLIDNQILVYNSTTEKFENSSEGLSIDGLGDTQITNLQDNQILIYNASSGKFVNSSSLSPTGVTAGTYGTATQIPQFTVTASGLVESAGEIAVATTINTTADTGTGSVNLLDSSFTVTGGTGINTSVAGNAITVNLDSSINSGTFGNLSLSGNTLASTTGGEIIIDPNPSGSAGVVTIAGGLVVQGTTTTINSTTLTVNDKNIVLADSAADATAADGAGITIDGASVNFVYSSSNDHMSLNKPYNITGGDSIGNAFLFNNQSFISQITVVDGGTF